ncbi:MAG: OmpH family outer membrane protein [Chthoniobacterales bacterium]
MKMPIRSAFTCTAVILSLRMATATGAELNVGTVDMNRVFKEYSKTKDAEAKLNEAKNAAKKEYDERADAYKKALDEINRITSQLDAPALSAEAKTQKAKQRDEKIANIKNMEREITEFRQTREQQLQQQVQRMRESILKEITDVVLERVKSTNLDLVFDKSGASSNGFSPLLFSRDRADFTGDVIAALNKAPSTSGGSPVTGASP